MKSYAFALSLLAAGLISAQTPADAPGPGGRGHMRSRGNPDEMFESRLTKHLNLTAAQQNTVHTALLENRTMAKGLNQQMHTLHTQMITAVKNGDEGTIESVTQQISALRQQQDVLHAKAMAKIYATLSADQKTKVGPNLEMLMGRGGPGFGFGGGFGGGFPPPPNGQTPTPPKQ